MLTCNSREFLLHDKLLSFCSSDSNNRDLSSSAFQTKIGKIMTEGFAASYSKVKFVSSIQEFLCYHHHPVGNKRNLCLCQDYNRVVKHSETKKQESRKQRLSFIVYESPEISLNLCSWALTEDYGAL